MISSNLINLSKKRVVPKIVQKDRVFSVLFFLMGLFACMSSMGIYVGGFGITFFTVIQILLVGYKVCFGKIKLHHFRSPLFWYFVMLIFSTFINLFGLPSSWMFTNFSTLVASILGYGGLYLLFSDNQLYKYKFIFIKGLKINFLIQLFWAFAQYILGNYFQISLNEAVHLYMVKTLPLNQIMSGLGWERAELALLLVIGYVLYKGHFVIRTLSIICLILMGSRTALIMVILLLVSTVIFEKNNNHSKNRLLKFCIVFVLCSLCVLFYWQEIYEYCANTFDKLINFKQDASGATHLFYYSSLPEMLTKLPFLNIIFGFGCGSSGYPYTLLYQFNNEVTWTVESTLLSQFWSIGIVGFIVWTIWMFSTAKICFKKNEKMIGALFIIVFICGIFYTLLCNWSFTVLIVLSTFKEKNKQSPNNSNLTYEETRRA